VLGSLAALAACLGPDPCLEPVAGTRADLTTPLGERDGITRLECPRTSADREGSFQIRGPGSRLHGDRRPEDVAAASTFAGTALHQALKNIRSFHAMSATMASDCDASAPPSTFHPVVYLADWRDADAAMAAIGRVLREMQLGETVILDLRRRFCRD
jgi:hypothetical protein